MNDDAKRYPQEPPSDYAEKASALPLPSLLACQILNLAECMDNDPNWLLAKLHLSPPAVLEQAQSGQSLLPHEIERILGLLLLISKVESMVKESVDSKDFDCVQWLATWLKSPVHALNDQMPADYLNSREREEVLFRLLTSAEVGSYQ
jgi:hypothetical protein